MESTLNIELNTIIDVIQEVAGISVPDPDQDFYDAGVTSVMALPLLMELEGRFEISVPDDQFIPARTARQLHSVVSEIKREQQ